LTDKVKRAIKIRSLNPEEARMKKGSGILVVTALHDTGHGECAATLLVTIDLVEAIMVAREAKRLGYEFHGNETGVFVHRMHFSRSVRKNEGDPVFFRQWDSRNGRWYERWFDPELKTAFSQGLEQRLLSATSRGRRRPKGTGIPKKRGR
jgi:hypothetical protein